MTGEAPGAAPTALGHTAWLSEVEDAVRGLASGILVGVPVVFTVDSWWLGDQNTPRDSLIVLAFAYMLTLAAVRWIGFHRGARRGWQYLADAAEALSLAVVALFIVFSALGQIGETQSLPVMLGRIAVALPPVALGVAVANNLFAGGDTRFAPDTAAAAERRAGRSMAGWQLTLHELGAALAGATFICFTIVPGNELNDIATEVPLQNLSFVVALSLLVSYVVVFAADFSGERWRRAASGPLQHPLLETVSAYVAALLAALFALLIFGHVDATTAPLLILAKTVLLGFPAAVGAAAGRLAV
jgi:putative integral membrane protein (TIGR02587 family)